MRKPVWVRVKVEDDLRCRFKSAAWRTNETPSQILRLLMHRYQEIQRDRYAFDLTVWGNIDRTVSAVNRDAPERPPVHVFEDEDEVTVARKLGWGSESFGRS